MGKTKGAGGGAGDAEASIVSISDNLHTTESRNVKRIRGGLVNEAHRLFALLNSRLESTKEQEELTRIPKPKPRDPKPRNPNAERQVVIAVSISDNFHTPESRNPTPETTPEFDEFVPQPEKSACGEIKTRMPNPEQRWRLPCRFQTTRTHLNSEIQTKRFGFELK